MDHRPAAAAAILGARVADAAALGLHWIYDPARIAAVAPERPEFLAPDLANYRGTTAYFAHGGKQPGDPTHYGEQLLVMERSLQATDGVFDAADYERRFVDTFGPGGTWVGYIDYPTRETLRNVDDAERAAMRAARAFDLGPHEKDRALVSAKVLANARRWSGAKLDEAMDRAVRLTHGDDEELMTIARAMAHAVANARGGPHGADDLQLPAVSKLAPLVARLAGAGRGSGDGGGDGGGVRPRFCSLAFALHSLNPCPARYRRKSLTLRRTSSAPLHSNCATRR
jgi:hypothetical protein